ncbi:MULTISPECIES: VOC family protein [Achromobacter]|uniref:VOC family protein n=1 Tax=Alcaligenes xylosoxydans xylosoxydans TaxID=85698 RepID=A0A424WHE0_ALCXX|nr:MULTISPECIES: VOC family protein [Achromobacter]MBC9902847.1 VOC family protein [Achromobacter xylosoxidans]MBD0868551.1 VOC family protein [Achromobacter xylosoxidans]QNP83266.1 VOC family protein [Achromobacter xylosoxidans]RPJ92702.1 VOC family protein [Achromobacter xylosoxidans]WLW59096.1 VOC family protein [Achromobacter aegrifaciens]
MPAFQIKHLDHVVLRVQDLARSVDFYTKVLGCSVKKKNDKLAMIHLSAGGSMIDLIDVQGPLGAAGGAAPEKERRNVDHFCLRVDPFDEAAIVQHLQAFGIAADKAVLRYGAEGEGLSIYCFDPDGNQIELKGPAV